MFHYVQIAPQKFSFGSTILLSFIFLNLNITWFIILCNLSIFMQKNDDHLPKQLDTKSFFDDFI